MIKLQNEQPANGKALDEKLLEYPFHPPTEEREFEIFPSEMEKDPHVFFHATHADNLGPIVRDGFKSAATLGIGVLKSVTFSKRSVDAVAHWCRVRAEGAEGVLIAVRYDDLSRQGLVLNASDLHDYTLTPPPRILSYCKIPSDYEHR